jgi:hypothetical protein
MYDSNAHIVADRDTSLFLTDSLLDRGLTLGNVPAFKRRGTKMIEVDEAHCRLILLTDEIAGLARLELSRDTMAMLDDLLTESRACVAELRNL